MRGGTARSHAPTGLMRAFLRLPIWLYRFRLGRLLGNRFVMLSHIGRRSGQLRQTVLEVVDADPARQVYIVASGWGRTSDWYRNIKQTPQVILDTARGRWPARATELSRDDAVQAFQHYAERHPRAFKQLGQLMLSRPTPTSVQGFGELAEHVPLVELRPIAESGEHP